jgi:glycolate oxidase iron-sulfur subunit
MQTRFTTSQLQDPDIATSEAILRKCVHCGFCTATCPTYDLLGDELDSPRGRIYQIQNMLEDGSAPTPETVKHVDRCLSCLSCVTTCPSGVDYMHLIDHARAHIEQTYERPWPDRILRDLLSFIMTRPKIFRVVSRAVTILSPLARFAPGRLKGMMGIVPRLTPVRQTDRPGVFPAQGPRRLRVAILAGCVQPAISPEINAAAIALLNRHGVEVVVAEGGGCCGALPHHLGKTARSHALAKAAITAWIREIDGAGLDAIVVTTSGCGTTLKDYGFIFRNDPEWADRAARVAALSRDITELIADVGLRPSGMSGSLAVTYHSACSLQHGQRIKSLPRALLEQAGFTVREPTNSHLCCGSAGTYNLLQPEIASQLGDRKVKTLEAIPSDVIAAGNLGCIRQIATRTRKPVVHTVELLNWATGGERPMSLGTPPVPLPGSPEFPGAVS